MEIIFFLIAIVATTVGAISGMGGGIMIKPAMDAISGLDVASISFMSGTTVLSMAIVSTFRGRSDELDINLPLTLPLAIGGAIGGIVGKSIFSFLSGDRALIQSVLLFTIYVGIYCYVQVKSKITSLKITNKGFCCFIGFSLGAVSSFLGIGGGPINMATLFFFFESPAKLAAKQSIFLILLSQTASFFTVLATGVPENVNYVGLAFMILGSCVGAVYGSNVSKKFTDKQVDQFFVNTLVAVMCLNIFNIGNMLA